MKFQYFIFLLLLASSVFITEDKYFNIRHLSSQKITKNELAKEFVERMERVDELKAIRELAESLGIKHVYLFGGSAAAWAHYVYWDLERERGIGLYDKSRFDYDYTSIFRANQDMDIVVDIDEKNGHLVKKFESELQKRFPHFQGNRNAWEVRPLRFDFGDKDRILDNDDFLHQNSDSHSTGLISVTESEEMPIRDFKDWDNKNNHFFNDVFERKLHFYRNKEKHKATKRFQKGLNPEIFSAIRYLTKAFQYELIMDENSFEQIRNVLEEFNPNEDLEVGYAKSWIEKNGKKLYQNAIDLEFAYTTMNKLNLQDILLRINNNSEKIGSLSWWMNKMPLLSSDLGDPKSGKTAAELNIDIVAHETNSFEAYESITKSHSTLPNVFISRNNIEGEAAIWGDGFYTKVGKEGARGTGLTIRFKVHPEAIEGVDFIQKESFLIFRNKNALKVIPESLTIPPVEYFRKIANGELIFDHSDKGVKEKVKRKIGLKLLNLNDEEILEIEKIVNDKIKNHDEIVFDTFFTEWFSLPYSVNNKKVLKLFLDKAKQENDENINGNLIKYIFSHKHWANDDLITEFMLNEIIESGNWWSIVENVLSHDDWALTPNGMKLLERVIAIDFGKDDIVDKYIFSNSKWYSDQVLEYMKNYFVRMLEKNSSVNTILEADDLALHPEGDFFLRKYYEYYLDHGNHNVFINLLLKFDKTHWHRSASFKTIIKDFVDSSIDDVHLVKYVFSNDYCYDNQFCFDMLDILIERGSANEIIIKKILSQEYWAKSKKGNEIIWSYIKSDKNSFYIISKLLNQKVWQDNPNFEKYFSTLFRNDQNHLAIIQYIFSNENIVNNSFLMNKLDDLLNKNSLYSLESYTKYLMSYVFSQPVWREVDDNLERISKLKNSNEFSREIIENVFSNPIWFNNVKFNELLKEMLENGIEVRRIVKYVLSHDYWADVPLGSEYLNLILQNKNNLSALSRHIFKSKAWSAKSIVRDIMLSCIGDDECRLDVEEVLRKNFWRSSPYFLEVMYNLMTKLNISVGFMSDYNLNLVDLTKNEFGLKIVNELIKKNDTESIRYLLNHILSKEEWAQHPEGQGFVLDLLSKENGKFDSIIIDSFLHKQYWQNEKFLTSVHKIIFSRKKINRKIAKTMMIHGNKYFQNDWGRDEIIRLSENPEFDYSLMAILSDEFWLKERSSLDLIEKILFRNIHEGNYLMPTLSAKPHWGNHYELGVLFEKLVIASITHTPDNSILEATAKDFNRNPYFLEKYGVDIVTTELVIDTYNKQKLIKGDCTSTVNNLLN